MENLNAENVKKWLEICAEDTPYPDQSQALLDALALINSQEQRIKELAEEAQTYKKHHDIMDVECSRLEKRNDELTEENERLKAHIKEGSELAKQIPEMLALTRADTVSELQTRAAVHFGTYTDKDTVKISDVFKLIDQIAKEMLEGEK